MKHLLRPSVLIGLLAMAGCTKMCGKSRADMTPDQVVEAYLDISLNMDDVAQKQDLLDLTTGLLHSSISQATDETLTLAFIDKNYKLISWSVVERRDRTPRETEITFQLIYNDLGKDPNTSAEVPKIETENTVSVVREKGIWLIRDVLGKKTSIDFPIAAGDVITPSAEP